MQWAKNGIGRHRGTNTCQNIHCPRLGVCVRGKAISKARAHIRIEFARTKQTVECHERNKNLKYLRCPVDPIHDHDSPERPHCNWIWRHMHSYFAWINYDLFVLLIVAAFSWPAHTHTHQPNIEQKDIFRGEIKPTKNHSIARHTVSRNAFEDE